MAAEEAVIDDRTLPGAYQMHPAMAQLELDRIQILPPDTAPARVNVTWFKGSVSVEMKPEVARELGKVIQFAAVRDPRLRVVKAIPLDVSAEEGQVIACWAEVNEFGVGETLGDAFEDFALGLRDLYTQLFMENAKLGPDLQRVKAVIQKYIEPRK